MKPKPSIRGLRWCMVALLFAVTVINYLDRQVLAVSAPAISAEFRLSELQYARVVMAFLCAYCAVQALAGGWLDRVGLRVGLALAAGFWSLACMAHALTSGAVTLGLAGFALGAAEACNFPAGIKVVADWFPAGERSVATGIFTAGSGLGAIIAPPCIGHLVMADGWRAGFVVTGLAGLLWILPWWLFYRDPAHHPRLSDAERAHIGVEREPSPGAPAPTTRWSEIFRRRELWAIFAARMLTDPVWWFYVFWLPKYLASARGFDLREISRLAWLPYFFAGLFSYLGGLLPGKFIKRGWDPVQARKLALVICACVMPASILAVRVGSSGLAIALIAVAASGHTAWAANLLTLPTDLFPKRLVGAAYGFTGTGGTLGGILISLFVGRMLETLGYSPVFAVMGSLHIIAAGLLLFLLRRRAPAQI